MAQAKEERQRAAAVHDAGAHFESAGMGEAFGVRQSSAAFSCPEPGEGTRGVSRDFIVGWMRLRNFISAKAQNSVGGQGRDVADAFEGKGSEHVVLARVRAAPLESNRLEVVAAQVVAALRQAVEVVARR